jgi:hypothetical protein
VGLSGSAAQTHTFSIKWTATLTPPSLISGINIKTYNIHINSGWIQIESSLTAVDITLTGYVIGLSQ